MVARRRFTCFWITFCCVVVATLHVVRADGVVRDGNGAISIGRGGTNIAHWDNGEILLDNPAAMANLESCGLAEIGFDMLMTDLHYSDPQNSVDAEVKPYPVPQLAYIRKGPSGDWAWGMGVFAPAGFGAEFDMTHPVFGLRRQKAFGALVKLLPGLAYRVNDRLSVGGALGLAASHVELEGPFHLQSGAIPGAPALFDLQSSGAALAWNVGLQYQLNDCTMLGVAYTAETRFRLDGTANATVPGLGNSEFDADVHMVWPRSLGIGLVHALHDAGRISLDVIWFDWSHAFDTIEMTISNPTNPAFAAVLGNVFQDTVPMDWKDSISIRTGYEYFLASGSVIRAGYIYHRNAVPNSTLNPYIPATVEHSASLGYGWRFANFDLDIAYQFMWGHPRGVGTSNFLGGDFDNSRHQVAAHWAGISFVRRF